MADRGTYSDRSQRVVGFHRVLLSQVSECLTAFHTKLAVFLPNSPDSVSELSECPDLLPNVTLKTENIAKFAEPVEATKSQRSMQNVLDPSDPTWGSQAANEQTRTGR